MALEVRSPTWSHGVKLEGLAGLLPLEGVRGFRLAAFPEFRWPETQRCSQSSGTVTPSVSLASSLITSTLVTTWRPQISQTPAISLFPVPRMASRVRVWPPYEAIIWFSTNDLQKPTQSHCALATLLWDKQQEQVGAD